MARRRHEAWQGPFAENPNSTWAVLAWLPLLHTGSRVRQLKIGCEKPCLISSSGSHWGFHTFPSGYSAEHCYGNWVLLIFWPNVCWGFTSMNLLCMLPDVHMDIYSCIFFITKEEMRMINCICLVEPVGMKVLIYPTMNREAHSSWSESFCLKSWKSEFSSLTPRVTMTFH